MEPTIAIYNHTVEVEGNRRATLSVSGDLCGKGESGECKPEQASGRDAHRRAMLIASEASGNGQTWWRDIEKPRVEVRGEQWASGGGPCGIVRTAKAHAREPAWRNEPDRRGRRRVVGSADESVRLFEIGQARGIHDSPGSLRAKSHPDRVSGIVPVVPLSAR